MSGDGRLRVLVVDDEPLARELLRDDLEGVPGVEVVGEAANGFEAVKAVAELAPDVMLLDVQMPKLDGFEVVELLDPAPAVIFVTAHDEYALRAFEVHAIDYLLKPVERERLLAALERTRERLAGGGQQPLTRVAAEARRDRGPSDRVLVREGSQIHVLAAASIDWVESDGDYLLFHCGGRSYRKKASLAELEERLDPDAFVRIHRAYLVALDRLERIEPYAKDSRVAFLADGTRLLVSRAGYARLRERL